jgi:hypothetical protein
VRRRQPEDNEPQSSSPVYVRLGMTKGASIAFLFFFVVVFLGFIRLEQLSRDNKKISDANRETLVALKKQQRKLSSGLQEVCRQTDTIQALTDSTIDLLKAELDYRIIPPKAIPAFTQTIRVFSGYSKILGERPACRRVLNP